MSDQSMMSTEEFNKMIAGKPTKEPVSLTLDQRMMLIQIQLLKSLRGMIQFFVILTVISLIVAIFHL